MPSGSFSTLADLQFKMGIYTNFTYYMASKIYLNDANTASADAYDLFGVRLGWKKTWQGTRRINIYAGADNLLDEKYTVAKVRPVDMFPHTHHIENVVQLKLKRKD